MSWLRRMSWKKRIALATATSLVLFLGLVGVGYALTTVPAPSRISTAQATVLKYADGSVMGTLGKNRTIVAISQISKDAQHAVLAAEDRDFYSEPGISPKGIARALFTNVKGGGVSQGGSTITQQYAKNAFLTQERTFTRKIKEVFIALKMSQTVSKDTILADYLNTIYFGRGAYGIQAAAKAYFNRNASALTVAQGAVLASSIRSPAGYEPTRHPEKAKARWEYVLKGMVDKGWLAQDDRDRQVYPTLAKLSTSASFPGPLDGIRAQVIDELERHGFPEDRIEAGGLTVTTTIEPKAQQAAKEAVESVIPDPTGEHPPVGALVSVDSTTGKVVAYYGNRTAGGFDYAGSGPGVQPGSSMKPYVLAAALKDGIKLSARYDGSSPQTVCGQLVHNDSGDPPFGRIDLATALEHSVNTVYLRLACDVGPKKVAALAHAAGIPDSELTGEGSLSAQIALGSGGYEVHPLDQAAGYATFAANGQATKPYFVSTVTDGGDQIYTAKPTTTEAFSEDVAADAVSAMRKVVTGGTGTRAQLDGRPTAGKTGTTSNNANAWFVGFTPMQLSTAVWIGREKGGPLKGVHFKTGTVRGGVYGGNLPAKIFKSFMDTYLDGMEVTQFPRAAGSDTGPPATSSPTPSATVTQAPTQAPSRLPSGPPTLPPVLETTAPPSPAASDSSSPAASP